eukprot:TRINITY_DN4_c2_g1_i1.p1 TRINITY_DN4_c2_g1~~TRINITY_DN4_c2_g1_i1.p1  ORF type:complete len:755 (-),score=258.81 TRINITY_DN4_c2_g1_i1:54-2318(-)
MKSGQATVMQTSTCSGCKISLQHPVNVSIIRCYNCQAITNVSNFTLPCSFCGTLNSFSATAKGFCCFACKLTTKIPDTITEELVKIIVNSGYQRSRVIDASLFVPISQITNQQQYISQITQWINTHFDINSQKSPFSSQFLIDFAIQCQQQPELIVQLQNYITRAFSIPNINYMFLSIDLDIGVDLIQLRAFYAAILKLPVSIHQQINSCLLQCLTQFNITEVHQLRLLVICLENPLLVANYDMNFLAGLSHRIATLAPKFKILLSGWFGKYKIDGADIIFVIVSLFNRFLACRIVEITQKKVDIHQDTAVIATIHTLGVFHMANKENIIRYTEMYNDVLSDMIDVDKEYQNWISREASFNFLSYPWILTLAVKNNVLKRGAMIQMEKELHKVVVDLYYRHVSNSPFLDLLVRREYLVNDTLSHLQKKKGELKKQLRVKFHGEEGIDAGGIKKEFFQLILQEIFDPKYGMFSYDKSERIFWFNNASLENEDEFELVGRIIGLAIYNGVILDLHFPLVIYKKLLNQKVTIEDLSDFKPSVVKGLHELLEFEGDVELTFCLNFTAINEIFGEQIVCELKPNGANIFVNNENRQDYVNLYIQFLLIDSVSKQFNAFKRGFDSVCGGDEMRLLRAEELEQLVCGSADNVDLVSVREATILQGFTNNSPVINYFWQVLQEMDINTIRKFLIFSTGSDRIPSPGVGALTLILTKTSQDCSRLPEAHTCFNQIVMPEYKSLQQTREKLLKAIHLTEGFSLK